MALYCLYFVILNTIVHGIFLWKNKLYNQFDAKKRTEYRAYLISMVHSIVSVFLSSLGMWWVCRIGKNVYNDFECMNTPKYIHLWALMHSVGYFIVDTFDLIFLIPDKKAYDYQIIAHHIISIATFCGTLVFMNFTVVFGVMLLFVEVSTPFICIRWFLYAHGLQHTIWNKINSVVCFFTFLIGRLLFQLYILFWYGYPLLNTMFQTEMPYWKVSILFLMYFAITVSAFANIYWMWLIINQIVRLVKRTMR